MTSGIEDLNAKKRFPSFVFRLKSYKVEHFNGTCTSRVIEIKSPNTHRPFITGIRKLSRQKLQSQLPMLGPMARQHGPKDEQPLCVCGGFFAWLCISPNAFSPWLPAALPHDWEPEIWAENNATTKQCHLLNELVYFNDWGQERDVNSGLAAASQLQQNQGPLRVLEMECTWHDELGRSDSNRWTLSVKAT